MVLIELKNVIFWRKDNQTKLERAGKTKMDTIFIICIRKNQRDGLQKRRKYGAKSDSESLDASNGTIVTFLKAFQNESGMPLL
jgi:hypothetical protein